MTYLLYHIHIESPMLRYSSLLATPVMITAEIKPFRLWFLRNSPFIYSGLVVVDCHLNVFAGFHNI